LTAGCRRRGHTPADSIEEVRRAVDPVAKQRGRLAAVEGELAGLQAQYELAMSAFKFDEANTLQQKIAGLEAERRVRAVALPPLPAAPEPPVGVVPAVARLRRGWRARRGR
jgi:hypothetical protein